jgi:DNA-binding transcriptional regulator YiaG
VNRKNVKVCASSNVRIGHGTIAPMPNIASVLKSEITRIARKEIRAEVEGLKKSASGHRTEIAALKRRAEALEQELKRLQKSVPKPEPLPIEETGKAQRFSAKGLASQRQRLGLSADAVGMLVGASGQSVYNWEAGKARPRASHLAAIAALRGLSKTQAAEVLASRKAAK